MDTIGSKSSSEDSDSPWKAKEWTRPFQLLLFEQIFCKRTGSRFNLEYVKDANGNAMSYTVNHTMMRINLATR
jgi:hypothetical protein